MKWPEHWARPHVFLWHLLCAPAFYATKLLFALVVVAVFGKWLWSDLP